MGIRNELGLEPNNTRTRSYLEKLKRLYEVGLTDIEIARCLCICTTAVDERRHRHNLPANYADDDILDSIAEKHPKELIQQDPESLFCDCEFLRAC
jgi:hypothetical protein